MKNTIKKISFAALAFIAMTSTTNAATTVKETADDFTNGKAYYVIGSTKFEGVTLTIQTIGTAYQHEDARLDLGADVKTLYKSPISGNWSKINEDGSMTVISDTEAYKDLDIYFVNNEVKMLDLKLDSDEKIGAITTSSDVKFVNDFNSKDAFKDLRDDMQIKITYDATTNTFKVPSIVTEFKVSLDGRSTAVSVVNGTLVKTDSLLVQKVTDAAGKELAYTTNANGDINITSQVPFEIKTSATRKNSVILYFPKQVKEREFQGTVSVKAFKVGKEEDTELVQQPDNYSGLSLANVTNSNNKSLTLDMVATKSGSVVDYDYLEVTITDSSVATYKFKISAKDIEATPVGQITRVAYYSENQEINVNNVKIENGNVTINDTLPSQISQLRIYISAPTGYSLEDIVKDNSLSSNAIKTEGNEYYFELATSGLASAAATKDIKWGANNTQTMTVIYAAKVTGTLELYTTDVDAEGATKLSSNTLTGSDTVPALDVPTDKADHYLNAVLKKPAGYVGTPQYAVVDATNVDRNATNLAVALTAIDPKALSYTNLPSDGQFKVYFELKGNADKYAIDKVNVYIKWSDDNYQKIEIAASSAKYEVLPASITAEDKYVEFNSKNEYKQHIVDLTDIKVLGSDEETPATNTKVSFSSNNESVIKVITQKDVDADKYYKAVGGSTKIDKTDIGKLLVIGTGKAQITITSDRLGSVSKVITINVVAPIEATHKLEFTNSDASDNKTYNLTVNPTGGSGEYTVKYELGTAKTFGAEEVKGTAMIDANTKVSITVPTGVDYLRITVTDAKNSGVSISFIVKVSSNTIETN